MFNVRQTILASRPAAIVLALALVAALTVPALLLPRANAAADPPLPCTEANYNGCTELSPTPPQDMVQVPPNIVLMLDDSGSMDWDYMPDWEYLTHTSNHGEDDAVNDSSNNQLWYNPTLTYTLPPKADGTSYSAPTSMSKSWTNGFTHAGQIDPAWYNPDVHYNRNLTGTKTDTTYGATFKCRAGFSDNGDPDDPDPCISNQEPTPGTPPSTEPAVLKWVCYQGGSGPASGDQGDHTCTITYQDGEITKTRTYAADQEWRCSRGSLGSEDPPLCHIPGTDPTEPPPPEPKRWICVNGGSGPSNDDDHICTKTAQPVVGAFMYIDPRDGQPHFVTSDGSHGTCEDLGDAPTPGYPNAKEDCIDYDDATGKAAPAGVQAGRNISIWFSFYRTRMLMAKSGLMQAFSGLDASYRFGFASINAGNAGGIPLPRIEIDNGAGDARGRQRTNYLAEVQPFGDGSSGSQKAKFWAWLVNDAPAGSTPLRKSLQAVGQYYQGTLANMDPADQPWTTMQGDPGYTATSTTKFACRASYTILTTDGFWNGDNPTRSMAGAANRNGPVQTVPSNDLTQYVAQRPFKGGSTDGGSLADVATYYWENDLRPGSDWPNEVSPSKSDPASWQHMTTYTVGLGFEPEHIQPAGTTIPQILGWAHAVDKPDPPTNPTDPAFAWPTPSSNDVNNIADLAHAAVNGHGDFFNVKSPQALADAFKKALSDIAARNSSTPAAAVNASVLSLGALSFNTGYDTSDWSGSLDGVTLKADGTIDQTLWSAGAALDSTYHSTDAADYGSRKVYTDSYKISDDVGTFEPFQFNFANATSLDTTETAGLQSPALADSYDTLEHRIDYLLGDSSYEDLSKYRPRTTILGAIVRSEPVYVAGATGNYYDNWPAIPGSPATAAPESDNSAQKFGAFVTQQSTQSGMLYIGANDGMLHAFRAPVPTCSTLASDGNCSLYTFPAGVDAGSEAWAFVPRAVYANLGNLTLADGFHYRPTVDATPVRRDVFFSENDRGGTAHAEWHTILAGGVGLGGRGVYALDVTDPESFSPTDDVLWEFDSDMTPDSDCVATYGTCKGTDLGYTVSQPNISRLHNGLWAVLAPNGYFPDCSTPDTPTNDQTNCQAIAAEAPQDSSGKPYSALFVLDAQTGKMIAELKTPTDISGVTSFGLATPVMGDYDNDQVDDVAFAGDVEGNLWRFDLSSPDPAEWTVTLVYKGLTVDGHQGVQPITTMPHLFPDPTTNRFMVLFGTGKFIGVGDNGDTTTQAIIAVRDKVGEIYSQDDGDLVPQYLHESIVPTGQPNAGATVRCVTGGANDNCTTSATKVNDVPASKGGWYIDLSTTTSDGTHNDAGERVVVSPGAIFASNTVIFETLITGAQSSDVCNPQTQGSILALNAISGAPAGVSSLGGGQIAGARINNARTSGSLPVVSSLGGGQAYLPGTTLAPSGTTPMSIDAPIWRRRSWQEINQNQ